MGIPWCLRPIPPSMCHEPVRRSKSREDLVEKTPFLEVYGEYLNVKQFENLRTVLLLHIHI